MDHAVAAVRRFNRFYTPRIGVLDEALLGTGLTLAEARVLWELGQEAGTTATRLEERLALDPGYLSRILRGLRERGWVRARRAAHDARLRELELTGKGRHALEPLERRTDEQVASLLGALGPAERDRLVASMGTIESLLGPRAARESGPYALRAPRAGDWGWVVERHGALYAREYGWDATFEGLVAEIVAKFLRRNDPAREAAWIAERAGERIGCVFLVRRSARLAQLRLLLVEPSARAMGVGAALVGECIRFAREARYRRMTLWTQSILVAARRLYERNGFRLVERERHRSFGADLVGENWDLDLRTLKAPAK
ncbi:MAG TPA: helix-turn-helix domain-containing GNAT family N-acetyltransferase [Usitatibacter sp.]|nr:helix-turn-helix domain-containing GNAT family N-acetyltransferase [Usitatibacter sp.]